MKSIVLPPRPTAEEAVALVAQDDGDDVAAGVCACVPRCNIVYIHIYIPTYIQVPSG